MEMVLWGVLKKVGRSHPSLRSKLSWGLSVSESDEWRRLKFPHKNENKYRRLFC
jgi:hypothetical protein